MDTATRYKNVSWYGEGDPAPAPAPVPAPADDPTPKTFTQEELNHHIASARRADAQSIELLKQAVSQQKKGGDSDDISAKLAEIQKTHASSIEVMKGEHEKTVAKLTKQAKDMEARAASLEKEYHDTLITSEIASAAAANQAYNPAQILSMMKPAAKVSDVLDATGKPTGQRRVMVTLPKPENPQETLTLPAGEAIKHMFDHPDQYGNLFKTHMQGITIGGTQSDHSAAAFAGDYNDYRKATAKKEK